MKEITIISGKGGTGKSTVVTSFAALAGEYLLVDCDVDAANLGVVFQGKDIDTQPYFGVNKPSFDPSLCEGCGECEEACRFDAIQMVDDQPLIDIMSCEGCAACAVLCPTGALTMVPNKTGEIKHTVSGDKYLVQANLVPGEGVSGKLVTMVRQEAKKVAEQRKSPGILSDGSPGVGCAVIATLTGTNFALVVTEPTQTGLHDLKRVVDLCNHFHIPHAVTVNKWDISPDMTSEIENYCKTQDIPFLAKIPFDPVVGEALARRQAVVDHARTSPASEAIIHLWRQVSELVESSLDVL